MSIIQELNQAIDHCEAALRLVPTTVDASPLIRAMGELNVFRTDVTDAHWDNRPTPENKTRNGK